MTTTFRPGLSLHFAWIILIVCFVNLFINYGIRLSYGVVLPELIPALLLNRREGGDIFNAYIFSYICLSPLAGYLSDRWGARRVIPLFGLLLGGGTFLMGTAQTYLQGIVFFGLAGAGAAAMWAPIITTVQRWFSVKRRGLAVGLLSVGYGLGFATMGYLFPFIVVCWGWEYFYFILGTAALVMVLTNAALIRGEPAEMGLSPWGSGGAGEETGESRSPGAARRQVYRQILRSKSFWIIGLSYASIGAALYLITTFMVDYARFELGFDLEGASQLAAFHGIGQIIGVLSLPLLSDYLGRRLTLTISNVAVAAVLIGIVIAGGNYSWLAAIILVLGIFYGATFPLYAALSGDYFPREIMASAIGALVPFYGTGAILAHRLGGEMRDVLGSFLIPFALAAVLALFAGFLLIPLKGKGIKTGR